MLNLDAGSRWANMASLFGEFVHDRDWLCERISELFGMAQSVSCSLGLSSTTSLASEQIDRRFLELQWRH